MIWILKWLILGHIHKWAEPSETGPVKNRYGIVIANYRECRCEKCGVWREFRT